MSIGRILVYFCSGKDINVLTVVVPLKGRRLKSILVHFELCIRLISYKSVSASVVAGSVGDSGRLRPAGRPRQVAITETRERRTENRA